MKEKLVKYNYKIKSYLGRLGLVERLWLLAPLVIWFSYQPRISLGANQTMNFELSLPLIYTVILSLVGIPLIWRRRRYLLNDKYVWLATFFVVWTGLTVLWSPNPTRAVLTFGITGCLYLIFLAAMANRSKLSRQLSLLCRLLLISSLVVCGLALAQTVAGVWLTGNDDLWLCRGCVASNFGFVRPNLFAIEPQFLGNLLLAPALLALWQFSNRSKTLLFNGICLVALTMTIVLTLSRGAIYAFAVGAVIIFFASIRRIRWGKILAATGLMAVGAVAALLIQGWLAVINPNLNVTFGGTVAKSINQLTLGVVKLDKLTNDSRPADSIKSTSSLPASVQPKRDEKNTMYDGYVAESTNIRVNLSKVALGAWWQGDWLKKIVGFGLGSSGIEMARYSGSNYQKEIVQNEFVEVLLERGAIGLSLLVALIGGFIWRTRKQRWLWGILAAYLAQYCFFSGLPNALHVYLFLMLALVFADSIRSKFD